ncbi:tripartite tricarboxylate transporter TctB family protein [Sodalis sp. dw_96]|uniref:tripartite tricarboxylate transporter TctB family protein n=1 Tax=Sodalis sp. dw_96 TaxID=2719794 RepID=UPI001BD55509|nr:tripartite tricarboxylate transporter TctB family protein [Sodalis sp. dw_96]
MRRADVAFGIVVAVVAAAVLVIAWQMPFYLNNVPGPGFLPRIVAGVLLLLGVILIVQSLRPEIPEVRAVGLVNPIEAKTHGKPEPAVKAQDFFPKRTVAVFLGYVVSVPLFAVIGFVLTGMLLMAYILLFIEKRRHYGAYIAIVAVPIVIYLLFAQVLSIELPNGPFNTGILGI